MIQNFLMFDVAHYLCAEKLFGNFAVENVPLKHNLMENLKTHSKKLGESHPLLDC